MASFNGSDLQVGMYDTAGGHSNTAVGKGTPLCMCFAVEYTPKEGHILDICLLVGKNGESILRKAFLSSDVAVGIQNPERNKNKLLPHCKDTDLSKYATSIQGSTWPTSKPSNDPTRADTTWKTTAPARPTEAQLKGEGSSGSGLGTEAKIALAVGIPGAITSLATILWWCHRQYRRA